MHQIGRHPEILLFIRRARDVKVLVQNSDRDVGNRLAQVLSSMALESVDHRFDPAANLLVLVQKRRPFGHELGLALPQGLILPAQLSADAHQFVHGLLEAFELSLVVFVGLIIAHALQYRAAAPRGVNRSFRGDSIGALWQPLT